MDPSFFYQQWPNVGAPSTSGWPQGMPSQGWFPYPAMPFVPAALDGHHLLEDQQQEQQQMAELQPMQPLPAHYSDETAMPYHADFSNPYANYVLPADTKPPAGFLITPPPSSSSSDCTTPPPLMDHPHHMHHQLQYSFDSSSSSLPHSGRSSVVPYIVTEPDTTLDCSIGSNDSPPTVRKERKQRGLKRKRQVKEEEEERERQREEQERARALASVMPPPNQTTVFCKVTGRLSVVGFQKLYSVTVDEIERRTVRPECLNRSHLGPLLRRGKIKGCGDKLQELLESRGLTSRNSINRKKHPLTCLSAILEEEASQFVSDHKEIAFAHFPFVGISRLVVRDIAMPSQLAEFTGETKAALAAVSPLVVLLKECMEADDGGVYARSSPFRPFSLASHGLGVEEAHLMAALLERYITVLDQETAAQMERVNTAALTNYHPLLQNVFPENTEYSPLPPGQLFVPDDEEESSGGRQFAEIPGRLTLNNRKYNVLVAEILRRVRAPESLNLSILGSQLRKGKTKDNGNSLRDALAKQGIQIDQGRRKSAKITCFTAMLEGETIALAEDLKNEVGRTFPFAAVATELNIRFGATTAHAIHCRRMGLAAASKMCKALEEKLLSLRLPIADRMPHNVEEEAYLLQNYSGLTHGYGPDTTANWANAFHKLFDYARSSLPMV